MSRYRAILVFAGATLIAAFAAAQQLSGSVSTPIETTQGVIAVNFVEFATIPDANGEAPRMMHLVDEPGTRRMFVSTMRGPLYSVSYDGKTVTPVPRHQRAGVGRQRAVAGARARLPELRVPSAVQPARHARATASSTPTPTPRDMTPKRRLHAARRKRARTTPCCSSGRRRIRRRRPTTAARRASCSAPRIRSRTTTAARSRSIRWPRPGSPEFGLLYVGFADGGSGGDPFNLAQNLASAFGKILRIDPLGQNSANGKYGIPASQSVRQRRQARHARRDLRLRRAQSAALLVGLEDRPHVRRRHRPEHRRGDQPGHRGRQPRLEQVGRQLSATSSGAGRHSTNPRGEAGHDLAGRRVRSSRSALPARRGHRRLHLSADRDQAAAAT